MRIRAGFEYGAGVCLWADDAEARERWCAAVEFADVGLAPPLATEGAALQAEWDAAFDPTDCAAGPRWSDNMAAQFHARAAAWTARVADALAPANIAVAPYGDVPAPAADGQEFEGNVLACFTDATTRALAEHGEHASFAWQDTATWNGDAFKYRETERSPAELLAKLEHAPGFVCGWWQASEGGSDAMLEGDPVEHAVACVRERNATGLANFLSWLRVERVHLGEELAALDWAPAPAHRLGDAHGSWWEWFSFVRNASAALRGARPSARYLRAERDRLRWRWTHGGSRGGWPANFGEALELSGLKREAFQRWAR